MKFVLISLIVASASSYTTIDPEILNAIFNSNVSYTTPTINARNQDCQCVPYYLCDDNDVGVNATNPSITGFGMLDVRFGEDDERQCQESIEYCCKIPSDPSKPVPQPNSNHLRGCGYRNPNGLGVTFSHATTQFGEFPWVVALLDSRNNNYTGVGVLINPEVVMTAAHIAFRFTPNTLKIRAGEWDTKTEREIYRHEERQVKEIVIHNNFNRRNLNYDMALLRLERPLVLTEHINVVCMPEQDEVFNGYGHCIANGWGKNMFGSRGHFAVILKKVELDMIPYTFCNMMLRRTRLGSRFRLHNSFVCAGGEEGKDTCQGDGGAPLVCPIGNDRYKLTGLTSWGIGCGQRDVPGAYTNVPKFREWVDRKMENWGLQTTSYNINDSK